MMNGMEDANWKNKKKRKIGKVSTRGPRERYSKNERRRETDDNGREERRRKASQTIGTERKS